MSGSSRSDRSLLPTSSEPIRQDSYHPIRPQSKNPNQQYRPVLHAPKCDQPTLAQVPAILRDTTQNCMPRNKDVFVIDLSANNDADTADLENFLTIECQEYSSRGQPLHTKTSFVVHIKDDDMAWVRRWGTVHEMMRAPCVVKNIQKRAAIGFPKVIIEESLERSGSKTRRYLAFYIRIAASHLNNPPIIKEACFEPGVPNLISEIETLCSTSETNGGLVYILSHLGLLQ